MLEKIRSKIILKISVLVLIEIILNSLDFQSQDLKKIFASPSLATRLRVTSSGLDGDGALKQDCCK